MDTLKSLLEKFMDQYSNEYSGGRSKDFGNMVRHSIPDEIGKGLDPNKYLVKGSVGVGRWTLVPWIAVFDRRITETARKGVYIVYLLNKETKQLFLTLNQGAKEAKQDITLKNRNVVNVLKENTDLIRKKLGHYSEVSEEACMSGSVPYDSGCIYCKSYDLSNIPNDEKLIEDLKVFIKIYQDYYKEFYLKDIEISEENVGELSMKDKILNIRSYIQNHGFTYTEGLLENFLLCLQSKPFVILAGISGTGKTKLVKLFAEAIGAEYQVIPVRPDWSDGSDLFGHYDLNGKFIEGPICESFKKAQYNPDKPVFVCLDEMNLARVEYYFSDILSVIESREMDENGKIKTAPIAQYKDGIPENLYFIGTVNMDETTFPFSKKVLDRANTIEFSEVELCPDFSVSIINPSNIEITNDELKSKYMVLVRDCQQEQEFAKKICGELEKINVILKKTNNHVGYRVRDEIVFYMLNNKDADELLTEEEAFDNEINQKILPRIQGSSIAIKNMLCELFKVCAKDYNQKMGDTDSEKMKIVLEENIADCKYPKSASKIELMTQRFEEDGFTSYWL